MKAFALAWIIMFLVTMLAELLTLIDKKRKK